MYKFYILIRAEQVETRVLRGASAGMKKAARRRPVSIARGAPGRAAAWRHFFSDM
jgi:hypothetical protein